MYDKRMGINNNAFICVNNFTFKAALYILK
jgi:hypothetical protein